MAPTIKDLEEFCRRHNFIGVMWRNGILFALTLDEMFEAIEFSPQTQTRKDFDRLRTTLRSANVDAFTYNLHKIA